MKPLTDSGSYVGKFALLNRSDSGDDSDSDDDDDSDDSDRDAEEEDDEVSSDCNT